MLIRFDDRRPGRRRSFGFTEPAEVLATNDAGAVARLIEQAEARARSGSWVAGWVSYEAAPGLDPVLATHPPSSTVPLVWFGVFDNRIVEPPWPVRASYELDAGVPEIDPVAYRAGIETIRRHIAAGDTYQANYTFRLRGSFTGEAVNAYRDLLDAQSAGFGAYFDVPGIRVMSVSPELFFRWDEEGIVTRPMKGTIKRGRWPVEDAELRSRLEASAKDHAENLMIVDLLRNDLGRIATFGSIEVAELFGIERYETVWQLTSTITATPRPEATLLDLFTALFPSGSVTGAPKARTMQIIGDLEPSPRGIYCGAIGVLAPPGSGEPRAQFNVAIRTLVVDATGATEYGTGGGITWDSVDEEEYHEAISKTAVLTHRRPAFSLLETMRWTPGTGIARRKRHVDRLATSAAYFGIPLALTDVGEALDALRADHEMRVRLLVGQDGTVRVEVAELHPDDGPALLAVDAEMVDPDQIWLFHKTTRRAVYDSAAARHPDADDVVLVNRDGFATETTRANLAAKLDGRWVTPPLGHGCLPGVLREELLQDGTLREQAITVEQLAGAHALAVVSSLRGWRPARLANR